MSKAEAINFLSFCLSLINVPDTSQVVRKLDRNILPVLTGAHCKAWLDLGNKHLDFQYAILEAASIGYLFLDGNDGLEKL